MKITDYIIRGGEDLNHPARKTPGFPQRAEELFNGWHYKLDSNDRDPENYFELPADASSRLFIRSFWLERSGHRPICYYIGLLIPKDFYQEAGEYYRVNRALLSISLENVECAIRENFSPISVNTEIFVPKSAMGSDFSKLSSMRLYGKEDFRKNIDDMCFAISINNIDDWFSRLFIAVNPNREEPEFSVVVSKEKPLLSSAREKKVSEVKPAASVPPVRTAPVTPTASAVPSAPALKQSKEEQARKDTVDSSHFPLKLSKDFTIDFFHILGVIVIVILLIFIIHDYISDNFSRKEMDDLRNDLHSSENANKLLMKEKDSLRRERDSLIREKHSWEGERRSLKNEIQRLQKGNQDQKKKKQQGGTGVSRYIENVKQKYL